MHTDTHMYAHVRTHTDGKDAVLGHTKLGNVLFRRQLVLPELAQNRLLDLARLQVHGAQPHCAVPIPVHRLVLNNLQILNLTRAA